MEKKNLILIFTEDFFYTSRGIPIFPYVKISRKIKMENLIHIFTEERGMGKNKI